MKKKIAIIFGGKSAEYEISLKSATNIINSIDKNLFIPILLGIDRNGTWFYNSRYDIDNINLCDNDFFNEAEKIYLSPTGNGKTEIINQTNNTILNSFEATFPIVHGTYGEDGTLQGYLKAMDIPFAGPDVIGSAIAMDKDLAKHLFAAAGIPVAKWFTINKYHKNEYTFEYIAAELKLPVFVKPANAGSSVGVSKVLNKKDYVEALDTAFLFDNKVLVEEAVIGKELECAILGDNANIKASTVGEIVATKDFYSYDAKYINSTDAILQIPANVNTDIIEQIRTLAVKACRTICCEGMSRVDFLLSTEGKLVLNEINTLPGFTAISMYPKLWEYEGISKKDLITELINLGIKRQYYNSQLSILR